MTTTTTTTHPYDLSLCNAAAREERPNSLLGGLAEKGRKTFIWHQPHVPVSVILFAQLCRADPSEKCHFLDLRGSLGDLQDATQGLSSIVDFWSFPKANGRGQAIHEKLDELLESGPENTLLILDGMDAICPGWPIYQELPLYEDRFEQYVGEGGSLLCLSRMNMSLAFASMSSAASLADRLIVAEAPRMAGADGVQRVTFENLTAPGIVDQSLYLLRGHDRLAKLNRLLRR